MNYFLLSESDFQTILQALGKLSVADGFNAAKALTELKPVTKDKDKPVKEEKATKTKKEKVNKETLKKKRKVK